MGVNHLKPRHPGSYLKYQISAGFNFLKRLLYALFLKWRFRSGLKICSFEMAGNAGMYEG
jgi:hypothetical protein